MPASGTIWTNSWAVNKLRRRRERVIKDITVRDGFEDRPVKGAMGRLLR